MTRRRINLASRPFANQAPVLRVSLVLAVVALVLLVVNIGAYRNYFAGSGQEAREELEALDRQIADLNADLARFQKRMGRFDLELLNRQVAFLNAKIAERTFGWSRLFDDLAAVLPPQVRLERLSPRFQQGGSRSAASRGEVVHLTLQGVARTDEALLDFIDALFAHPRFLDPSPSRQTRDDGQVRFTLFVTYRPPSGGETRRGKGRRGSG